LHSPSELVERDDPHKPTDAGADGRESGNAPRPPRTIILSRRDVRIPCVPTQRAATVELRSSLYADATAIVEREYAADLSLDSIARRVASSRRQLQRAYSEIGDTTFREHLTRVRMDRAAELLEHRGMTVREVARRVGYRQPAQFAKAFRRHLGVAPSDFRAAGGGGRGVVGDAHRLAA
jgi:AraC family transcriptional regulator, regulatory protein of adaptative response / methylphosphotriester-DNA alkyltransferase methyltransferase